MPGGRASSAEWDVFERRVRTRRLLALGAPRLVSTPLEPSEECLRRFDGKKLAAIDGF